MCDTCAILYYNNNFSVIPMKIMRRKNEHKNENEKPVFNVSSSPRSAYLYEYNVGVVIYA